MLRFAHSRYLLVRASSPEGTFHPPDNTPKNGAADRDRVPMVALDPKHQLKTQATHIEIPRPDYMLETIVKQRIAEYQESDNDDVDRAVFDGVQENQMIVETDNVPSPPPKDNVNSNVIRAKGDWKHDAAWVKNCVQHLLPPPVASTPTATMALQRELRAILREQRSAPSLRDLGW
jgi:ubiquitin-conjugating enzyme E2 Q